MSQDNKESFVHLFEEGIKNKIKIENSVLKGTVSYKDSKCLYLDLGLKSEGVIPANSFSSEDWEGIEVGSKLDVFVERYEDSNGNIIVSLEKAQRERDWQDIEKLYNDKAIVQAKIIKKVKGGFAVSLEKCSGFLPGSQLDIRPIKNVHNLIGTTHDVEILKIDRTRYSVIVSRKSVIETKLHDEGLGRTAGIKEGDIIEGTVKNITGYGAFLDLGYLDGLLHVTDMSWSRINHPSEILSLNEVVKVRVIKINPDTRRVSLGMKQLRSDPWVDITEKYKVGQVYEGEVSNVTEYGAFVSLEEGIAGLVHASELDWTDSTNINPRNTIKIGQKFKVLVLEIDPKKRRINLSVRQCTENPWLKAVERFPKDGTAEGTISEVGNNYLKVDLGDGILGIIKHTDIHWGAALSPDELSEAYKEGNKINTKVLYHDLEKFKVFLGVKQLTENPFANKFPVGSVVAGTIKSFDKSNVLIDLKDEFVGKIDVRDLSYYREQQNINNLSIGDELEGKVIGYNNHSGYINISIKELESELHKKHSSDKREGQQGDNIGDMLSELLKIHENDETKD